MLLLLSKTAKSQGEKYREANKCADFLARAGLLLESEFVVFPSPPVDLVSLLEADAVGLFVNRLCNAPVGAV